MSVRTYNSSVRVGNWNEDLCLEEDLLKDFLEKKENGELLIHKERNLASKLLKSVDLSISKEGFITFGAAVCLYNPVCEENLSLNLSDGRLHEVDTILSPCDVSASKILQPCYRNTFKITSCDGTEDGSYLSYGQPFLLNTLVDIGEELRLTSDVATFMKSAKKSRLQEVSLTSNLTFLSHWQILHFDPQQRLETEGSPVPANTKVLFNHCKTNQRLAVLPNYSFRGAFGREHEIVAHTFLDSHKAEKAENHWIVVTN